MQKVDEFAVLSAIWILSCNDEKSLVTYRGIRYRLHLPDSFDLEGLIQRHGELFRLGMPESRLDQWKTEMRANKRLPAWIRAASPAERSQYIDHLKPEDGFRSQFRSGIDAPKSDVVVIEWGLTHIERLRKANAETREANAKSWQIWLVFATSILGVVATIVAALIKGH